MILRSSAARVGQRARGLFGRRDFRVSTRADAVFRCDARVKLKEKGVLALDDY